MKLNPKIDNYKPSAIFNKIDSYLKNYKVKDDEWFSRQEYTEARQILAKAINKIKL